jgi:hypothetical protein
MIEDLTQLECRHHGYKPCTNKPSAPHPSKQQALNKYFVNSWMMNDRLESRTLVRRCGFIIIKEPQEKC